MFVFDVALVSSLNRIKIRMGRQLPYLRTHSSPWSIYLDESPKSFHLFRLAEFGIMEFSNRYVVADVAVVSDLFDSGVWRDSVFAHHDPLDLQAFYQLDPSASRERGADEQHLKYHGPVVRLVHRDCVLEDSGVRYRKTLDLLHWRFCGTNAVSGCSVR